MVVQLGFLKRLNSIGVGVADEPGNPTLQQRAFPQRGWWYTMGGVTNGGSRGIIQLALLSFWCGNEKARYVADESDIRESVVAGRWRTVKAILPLGVAATVLGFLFGVLSQFPINGNASGAGQAGPGGDETFSVELVEKTADQFHGAYAWVIDDMLSYQKNLDRLDVNYQRAESQRQAMVTYADALIPQFKELANKLEGQLNGLTGEYESQLPAQ